MLSAMAPANAIKAAVAILLFMVPPAATLAAINDLFEAVSRPPRPKSGVFSRRQTGGSFTMRAALRASTGVTSILSNCATVWMTANWVVPSVLRKG
jgi:hypothetical protein